MRQTVWVSLKLHFLDFIAPCVTVQAGSSSGSLIISTKNTLNMKRNTCFFFFGGRIEILNPGICCLPIFSNTSLLRNDSFQLRNWNSFSTRCGKTRDKPFIFSHIREKNTFHINWNFDKKSWFFVIFFCHSWKNPVILLFPSHSVWEIFIPWFVMVFLGHLSFLKNS